MGDLFSVPNQNTKLSTEGEVVISTDPKSLGMRGGANEIDLQVLLMEDKSLQSKIEL